MRYDLALCCVGDSEIGYGHIMRTFALAEAAVWMEKKVIVVINGDPPPLTWPCPVLMLGTDSEPSSSDASLVIFDFPLNLPVVGGHRQGEWRMIDVYPSEEECKALGDIGGLIYPHFGARPVEGFPTLVGQQWMPVQDKWRIMGKPMGKEGRVLYRVPEEVVGKERHGHGRVIELGDRGWESSSEAMAYADRVVCPPCTFAYEAAAAGRLVNLVCEPDHPSYPIGEAMVAAGYASWWGGPTQNHRMLLKTEGAKRILEALL